MIEHTKEESHEILLRENKDRFVVLPIKFPDVWEMYKKHEASFWTAEEIDLYQDLKDWDSLSKNEKHFITHVLAFLPPATASSMRTWPPTSWKRCKYRKHAASMDFRS